jgi:hypothetical protein
MRADVEAGWVDIGRVSLPVYLAIRSALQGGLKETYIRDKGLEDKKVEVDSACDWLALRACLAFDAPAIVRFMHQLDELGENVQDQLARSGVVSTPDDLNEFHNTAIEVTNEFCERMEVPEEKAQKLRDAVDKMIEIERLTNPKLQTPEEE